MAKLTEEQTEALRLAIVRVILAVRGDYLRTPAASVLKHWDQITDRMRARAQSCGSPREWASALLRDLRIASPSDWTADAMVGLQARVDECGAPRAFFDLIDRESGYLIAVARTEADSRRAARQAA